MDLSYQKTDKLTVIVDHYKDQINRFVTSFPGQGVTLLSVNQSVDRAELLEQRDFPPLTPPEKKNPPVVSSVQANLAARVAQLSPKELEMWKALNGES